MFTKDNMLFWLFGEEPIHLMFSRWLQENDFKYMEKHFGINRITSYRKLNTSAKKIYDALKMIA